MHCGHATSQPLNWGPSKSCQQPCGQPAAPVPWAQCRGPATWPPSSSPSQVKVQNFEHPQWRSSRRRSCPGAVQGSACLELLSLETEETEETEAQRQKDRERETNREMRRQKHQKGDRRGEVPTQKDKKQRNAAQTSPWKPLLGSCFSLSHDFHLPLTGIESGLRKVPRSGEV